MLKAKCISLCCALSQASAVKTALAGFGVFLLLFNFQPLYDEPYSVTFCSKNIQLQYLITIF